ncbi:ferrous iron transport protein B, partial [Candidatus Bathyarchaeota archaeon]
MKKKLRIALAGNANVGKSVIFNQLTGLHQHIGNWPGKTVTKAEGTLHFKGYEIDVIDLPGIYSLSTFSLEEIISREYIAFEKPDLVINVVDASVLERNLFFTLQLIELGTPMIIALNQIDIAQKKGIKIDYKKLSKILGVPVIPTIAIRGYGIYDLLAAAVKAIEEKTAYPSKIRYGKEIEGKIEKIAIMIKEIGLPYPARWTAIKLLEGDKKIQEEVRKANPEILSFVQEMAREIEEIHGHPCSTVITSERYDVAGRIAREVQKIQPISRIPLSQRLHELTTSRVLGYPIMLCVVLSIFYGIFTFGDYTSTYIGDFLYSFEPLFDQAISNYVVKELIWNGVVEGIIAGVTIALPYIVPFYLILYVLEDSGYLSRIAFLMDVAMHKIGLHGKAFIPVMLAYGCNVPACLGCKIMETERERLLAAFVVTLIPCAATTVVVLGLVGKFVGI